MSLREHSWSPDLWLGTTDLGFRFAPTKDCCTLKEVMFVPVFAFLQIKCFHLEASGTSKAWVKNLKEKYENNWNAKIEWTQTKSGSFYKEIKNGGELPFCNVTLPKIWTTCRVSFKNRARNTESRTTNYQLTPLLVADLISADKKVFLIVEMFRLLQS